MNPVARLRGFTLLEMAIVLAILTVLSIGALSVLRAQSVRGQQNQTRDQLIEAREALMNFALANNGRLPCPAPNDQGIAMLNCAAGAVSVGWIPWATLGIAQTDVWGQALHYKVTTAFTAPPPIPRATQGAVEIWRGSTSTQIIGPGSIVFAIWSSGEDQIDASAGAAPNNVNVDELNDDSATWLSRFVLLGRLIEVGIIPP